MKLRQAYASFINGTYIDPSGVPAFDACSPTDGHIIARIAAADAAVVDQAVDAARTAFSDWSALPRSERSRILFRMADALESNTTYFAAIETEEVGKPTGEAVMQIGFCVQMYRYFAAAVLAEDDILHLGDDGTLAAVIREPMGVVGLILPWNAPSMLLSWKLAPALAAGNCVVIKPSSDAVLSVLEMAGLWKDILPSGVLNVVVGAGSSIGDAFTGHPGFAKISFTGSSAVGSRIAQRAGASIVPCTLELGGKSASILFEDANMNRAIQMVMLGILSTSGEVCIANSRLLVQDTIYDWVLRILKEKFEAIRVGNPADPATQMGPLISETQMNKVLSYIDLGIAEGAVLVCGGKRLTGNGLDRGWFLSPTIFESENYMRIAQEEIFGPVLTLIRFHSEEDAIQLANDSEYGLGGSVWTQDISRAIRVSRRIQAGTVWINDYLASPPGSAFGGFKKSGIGREIHKMAIEQYSNIKTINICSDTTVPPLY